MRVALKMMAGASTTPEDVADSLGDVVRHGFGRIKRHEGMIARLLLSSSRWLLQRRWGHAVQAKQMQVIETLSLGGRRQMMLVLCQGERFLVGCGADQVQTIVHVPAKGESCP